MTGITEPVDAPTTVGSTSKLVADISHDGTRYLMVERYDEAGGEILLRIDRDGTASLLAADTAIDPKRFDLPKSVLEQLSTIDLGTRSLLSAVWTPPPGPPPADQLSLDSAVAAEARQLVGQLITSDVPGTELGHLACAWALNKVVLGAIGKEVGGGLSTADMYDVLRAHDRPLTAAQAVPGCIVVSPTVGATHGHAGIMGAENGPDGTSRIYSNSSRHGVWSANYTVASWKAYFTGSEGLDVLYFELDWGRFRA